MRRTCLFVALLASICGAQSAPVHLETRNNSIAVIGSGWTLTYGHFAATDAHLLLADGRVWLSHGPWLRLIDPKTGNVLKRWHLNAEITRLSVAKGVLQAATGEQVGGSDFNGPMPQTVAVDPETGPAAPFVNEDLSLRVSRQEAEADIYPLYFEPPPEYRMSSEKSAAALAQLQARIAHDRFSPWLQIFEGRLRRDLADPEYRASFAAALEAPSADYTELLAISSYMEKLGETESADKTWSRGMTDYLSRGCDPRTASEDALGYFGWRSYQPFRRDNPRPFRPEVYDRIYFTGPGGGADGFLWRMLGDHFERSGDSARASLWRQRADRQKAMNTWPRGIRTLKDIDQAALWVAAIVLACFLFLLGRHLRYGPDLYSDDDVPEYEFFGLSRLQFWPRLDRFWFLLLVLAAWLLTGYGGLRFEGKLRSWRAPVGVGTGALAGVANENFLRRLPESPERELLRAIALQQSGRSGEVESAYRALPQFPESWNNLGVLLAGRGDQAGAQAAFARAGDLPEARFNRSSEISDEWTRLYSNLQPGKKMSAPPSPAEWSDAMAGPFGWERMLLGPLVWLAKDSAINQVFSRYSFERGAMRADLVLSMGLLLFAVVLNLLPHRRAVKVPPTGNRWLELLFPGTSPRWSGIGPALLVAWCFLLLQMFARMIFGIPYFLTAEWTPFFGATWIGLPVAGLPSPYSYLRPPAMWMYGAPAAMFVVNAAVVRWRRSIRDREG